MPASPARAARRRARRLAAGVATSALAALALGAPAQAYDREVTVGAGAPAGWDGQAALAGRLFDPATLTPCGSSLADVCDTTLVHVEPSATGTLAFELSGTTATPDVDLYVYRGDGLGALAGISAGPGADERVTVPNASGTYLVKAVSFAIGSAGYHGLAGIAARAAAPLDVDHPRGLQEELVSSPSAGAASQPSVARSPRDRDLLVAAYRVFGDPAVYESQIATSVSFDGGRDWWPLGAVATGTGANPSVAFDSRGDAHLAFNSEPASEVSLRAWRSPSWLDVLRHATWGTATAFPAPAGAADERPVLAADRAGALLACWIRNAGGQTVMCAAPGHDPVAISPASRLPFGPYVTGVALTADRRTPGAFTTAWVDTLTGARDGSGIDPVWTSSSSDGGTTWGAPVLAARARPLPHSFEGETFRNVPLLSLAAGRDGRRYLAYAAEQPDRGADVRLVRSDDGGAHWAAPVSVNQDAGAADQFQPSVAVAGREVAVAFLDRRLDASNTFADEWLARSRDGGATWRETRLSHDSWDPATGAPHSPTGDLLGDHQALAASRCSLIALAADPHLANPHARDRGFDRHLTRTTQPQLFAWRVKTDHC
jgi:hypothetical protein